MHSSLSKTGKKTNSQGTFRGKLQFIRTITPQFATRFIHPGTSAQKGVPSRKSFCSKTTFPGNKTYSTFSLASSRGIELLSFAARFADAVALKLIPPESQRAEQAKAGNSRRDRSPRRALFRDTSKRPKSRREVGRLPGAKFGRRIPCRCTTSGIRCTLRARLIVYRPQSHVYRY